MTDQQRREREQATDAELRAAAYFAIGKSSEGSYAGRDVSYELRFAGTIDAGTRRMHPVANSGYTIGSLQTDLGQHRDARIHDDVPTALVDHYQDWARSHQREHPGWVLTDAQRTQAISDLRRQGNEIRDANGVDLDATTKSRLNTYLASDEGTRYIHGRDVAQIDRLMRAGDGHRDHGGALAQLRETALYTNATVDDQLRLATLVSKLENQSDAQRYPGVIRGINNGTLGSVDDVKGAIDRMLPNARDGRPDYLEDGANHALNGAEVLVALRNADTRSPLHDTWRHVVADPLADPVALRNRDATALPALATNPDLPAEYDTVKTLFLMPEQARPFIRALDEGNTYTYGRPQPEGNHRATAGFFTSGNDFVVWNQDGHGHARIGGEWRDIERQNLTRVRNNDGTTDLDITENGTTRRLLHVDPHAPNFRNTRTGSDTTEELRDAQPPARLPGGVPAHPQGRPQEDEHAPDQQQGRRQPAGLLLDDAAHPGHAMYASLLGVVHERDRTLGREPDDFSRQLAGGLTAEARARGLQQIGFATFTPDGRTVAMTDTPDPTAPWARTAVGAAADLAAQPLAQSSEQVSRLAQQQAVEQSTQAPSQQQGVEAVQRGPRLA